MFITRDDDGTVTLHETMPFEKTINGYKYYYSPNSIILHKFHLDESLSNGPFEIELNIKNG